MTRRRRGLVGEVVGVNPGAVMDYRRGGPGAGRLDRRPRPRPPGQALNVNADSAAAALAVGLSARKLVVLTDVEGIYAGWPDRSTLIARMSASRARELLPTVSAGMIPKLEACIRAVDGGVPQAHVIDGRQPHSMLLEVFTAAGSARRSSRPGAGSSAGPVE